MTFLNDSALERLREAADAPDLEGTRATVCWADWDRGGWAACFGWKTSRSNAKLHSRCSTLTTAGELCRLGCCRRSSDRQQ